MHHTVGRLSLKAYYLARVLTELRIIACLYGVALVGGVTEVDYLIAC